MTIVFPRDLPAVSFAVADFVLSDPVRASASGARLINYTQVEDPIWQATLTTRPLRFSAYQEVEAWWLSLRSGLRTVLFRNPLVCYPRAHWDNHGPADDAGSLVAVTDGNVLSVNSVSPDLVLAAGDLVGLERTGRYYVGRVVEVSGAGVARSITVEPPPFDSVALPGAVVRFAKPALVMRPVPGSYQAPRNNGRYSISFQLQEG